MSMNTQDRCNQQSWKGEKKIYIAQVSMNLAGARSEVSNEMIFETFSVICSKFIRHWIRKRLMNGLIHIETNKIIDDAKDYDSWINNFRIVG